MRFTLTEEQTLLKESVRRFIEQEHDFEQARAIARSADGQSDAHWQQFAELGWLALMVPEDFGGLGGSLADAALLMEEFGRGLVAAPYLSTAIIAAELISSARPEFAASAALLEQILDGSHRVALATEEAGSRYDVERITTSAANVDGKLEITGEKIIVHDGATADSFILSANLRLADGAESFALLHVPAVTPGLSVRHYATIDGRRACDLSLDRAEIADTAIIATGDAALQALRTALDHARLMLASEALGLMDAAIEQTADYIKTRQQFGRALATFQVLQHRLADMFVKLENARSMVLRGLSMSDAEADERAAAVSGTMVSVLQAAEFVCGQAIQLHGGIGMTEEMAIGHYYKRSRAIGKTYGDLGWHMARYIAATQNEAIKGRGAA